MQKFTVGMVVELTEDVTVMPHVMVADFAPVTLKKGMRGIINNDVHAPIQLYQVMFGPRDIVVTIDAQQMQLVPATPEVDTQYMRLFECNARDVLERNNAELRKQLTALQLDSDREISRLHNCVAAARSRANQFEAAHRAAALAVGDERQLRIEVERNRATAENEACKWRDKFNARGAELGRLRDRVAARQCEIDTLKDTIAGMQVRSSGRLHTVSTGLSLSTKQRDAAYAALDAVLDLMQSVINDGNDSVHVAYLAALLLKHGVHPK